MTDEKLLTSREVADLFAVHPRTVWRWSNLGLLDCIRTPSGQRRYLSSQVREFLNTYGFAPNYDENTESNQ